MTEANGVEPTEDALKVEVDKRILPYMNIVRGWLGLASVDSVDEMAAGTENISEIDTSVMAQSSVQAIEQTVQEEAETVVKKETDISSLDKETKAGTEE